MSDFLFNPHQSRTGDGVLIESGLAVFDNNLDAGRVVGDSTSESLCCGNPDHTRPAQDRNGFSDHQAAAIAVEGGCYCRHDHWFEIELVNGSRRSMNGERLATRFSGKRAEDEVHE